jgi:hypothetical protein
MSQVADRIERSGPRKILACACDGDGDGILG